MITIEKTNARGVRWEFIIVLHHDGQHAYLHTDGQWCRSCASRAGMTGYHASRAQADQALSKWIASMPLYETRYSRRRGEKIIRRRITEVQP